MAAPAAPRARGALGGDARAEMAARHDDRHAAGDVREAQVEQRVALGVGQQELLGVVGEDADAVDALVDHAVEHAALAVEVEVAVFVNGVGAMGNTPLSGGARDSDKDIVSPNDRAPVGYRVVRKSTCGKPVARLALLRPLAGQSENREAADGDEDQAEQQSDGEQTAFVADDAVATLACAMPTDTAVAATMVESASPTMATNSANATVRRSLPSVRVDGASKPELSMLSRMAEPITTQSSNRLHDAAGTRRPLAAIAAKPVAKRGVFVAPVKEG